MTLPAPLDPTPSDTTHTFRSDRQLHKAPSGIQGLDEITLGGLPRGRPTLICGGAGCGKTLMAMEFLVRGAGDYDEPGVFVAFEERPEELAQNVRSLGFDLDLLTERGKLLVDYVHIERSEIDETGEFDLDGLFIRLGHAIDSIGAKRVVLDTIEALFAGFSNEGILRAELRRLFRWLKEKGVTAVITAERGDGTLTRHGLEEYVSDCVIQLDHRVTEQICTRRLRIVKYRGSAHGTNEYPFLIDETGTTVLPITSLGLRHEASTERISTGVPRLDAMLGGDGVYRGSSVLLSGTSGTGKTSLACHFAAASARRGERCLYMAFEESPGQIVRNMRSIGLDLAPWLDDGLIRLHSSRPTLFGLESHLALLHKQVREFQPAMVVVDPISNFVGSGSLNDAGRMLVRMIDFLKLAGVTSVFVNLNSAGQPTESTDVGISSIIDVWLLLRDIETNGERNRGLHVLKSRGSAHSNQIREFLLTSEGIQLLDVDLGPDGILTGSARLARQARRREEAALHAAQMQRRERELQRRRQTLDSQITALRLECEQTDEELRRLGLDEQHRERRDELNRHEMFQSRKADDDLRSEDRANLV